MDERDERSDTPTNLHDNSSEHISSTQKQKQHNGNDSHDNNGTAQNSSGMNFKISSRGLFFFLNLIFTLFH